MGLHSEHAIKPGNTVGVRGWRFEYWAESWRPYGILLLLSGLVFGRTLWFGYTYFDDDIIILQHFSSISGLSQIGEAFRHFYFVTYYRPIVTLSFILDARISGISPWMYHLSNYAYHLVATCLVFVLLSKLGVTRKTALIASALFTISPVLTQSVAWIPGRNDSLLAIFVLVSVITLAEAVASGRASLVLLHIVCFFISLLTKETALILPLIYLWYLHFVANVPVLSRETGKYIVGWLIAIAAWFFMRSLAIEGVHRIYTLSTFIGNLRVPLELLGKMVVPFRMSGYATFDIALLGAGICIVLAMAFLMITRRNARSPLSIFGIIWIVSFILPSLVVHTSGHRFDYLESRAYTSVAGMSILIAALFERNTLKSSGWWRAAISLVALLYAAVASGYSLQFRDGVSFWTHAVKMSPTAADAHYSLGLAYMRGKNIPKAVASYREAVALDPTNIAYHNNLGIAYGEGGSLDDAESEFQEAARLHPSDPIAYANLGMLYFQKKNFSAVEQNLKQALALDSNFTDVERMLIALYKYEQNEEGARYYTEKLQHQPPKTVSPDLPSDSAEIAP